MSQPFNRATNEPSQTEPSVGRPPGPAPESPDAVYSPSAYPVVTTPFAAALGVAGPPELQLASRGRRLGAFALDYLFNVLSSFLLGLPYLIWWLVTLASGQTPGKRLLGMRTVDIRTGAVAGYGRMLLREVVAKAVVGLFTLGIGVLWVLWDDRRQTLYDKMAGTIVVLDPHGRLR